MNHDLPLAFPSAPPELKRDLERLAGSVRSTQQQVARDFSPNLAAGAPVIAAVAASFGRITRIGALSDTDRLVVRLPLPDVRNAGRQLSVSRANGLGCVYVVAPGALINGRGKLMLLGSKLITTITFDGVSYFADNDGASPWGGL